MRQLATPRRGGGFSPLKRRSGSKVSSCVRRSTACGWQLGNRGCQSGLSFGGNDARYSRAFWLRTFPISSADGVPVRLVISSIWWYTLWPGKSGFRRSSSAQMQPAAQISTAAE
jgi:hypothetical protein